MAKHRLLVADDSLTIQKIIRLALSNENYEIQAVSSGEDALEKMSLFKPSVVLVDVSLPGKTAFELKREATTHADLKPIRFILLSSAFEKVDEDQLEEVGFDGRLVKPFDPQHLRQVLQDVLKGVQPPQSAPSISPPAFSPPAPKTGPAFQESKADSISDPEIELNLDLSPSTPTPPPFSAHKKDPMLEQLGATREEDDIRHLTESTIKMSGLDETDWNVSGPGEELKSTAFIPLSDSDFEDLKLSEPSLTPDSPMLSLDPSPQTFEPLDSFEATEPGFLITDPPPSFEPLDASMEPSLQVSPSQLEEMIKNEVEVRLREMAQDLLPEIAERLLKEEIHKMLEGQSF